MPDAAGKGQVVIIMILLKKRMKSVLADGSWQPFRLEKAFRTAKERSQPPIFSLLFSYPLDFAIS
jgi:hypothetical protein